MKIRAFLSAMFVFFAIALVQAQPQQMSAEERAKDVIGKIKPALSLSDGQSDSTLTVFKDYYQGFEKFREQMRSGNRPDQGAMQALTDERDAKLKKIFSKDQYKKFKNEVEETLRPQRQGGPRRQ